MSMNDRMGGARGVLDCIALRASSIAWVFMGSSDT